MTTREAFSSRWGVIVGGIALTGGGARFSSLLLTIADQNQYLAMFFAMCSSIILGMGMPTTAAYAVAAAVVAPGLIQLGVPVLVAHFFVFYYAVMSAITPPVAVAAYAASGIAQASPAGTALQAVRLGIIAFVIPFFFVYRPELLLVGSPLGIVTAIFTSACGVLLIAGAFVGFMRVPARAWERIGMAGAGLALIAPGVGSDVAGLALGIVVAWRQLSTSWPSAGPSRSVGAAHPTDV